MSRTMRLIVDLECDNSNCGATTQQEEEDFCGDSSQVPDLEDIDWVENRSEEVFCDDCHELAKRILDQ